MCDFFHFAYSDEDSNGDILGTHLALDDGGFTVMLDYLLSGFDSNPANTIDGSPMFRWRFAGQVVAVTLVSCLSVSIGKRLQRRFAPAPYSKVA